MSFIHTKPALRDDDAAQPDITGASASHEGAPRRAVGPTRPTDTEGGVGEGRDTDGFSDDCGRTADTQMGADLVREAAATPLHYQHVSGFGRRRVGSYSSVVTY